MYVVFCYLVWDVSGPNIQGETIKTDIERKSMCTTNLAYFLEKGGILFVVL